MKPTLVKEILVRLSTQTSMFFLFTLQSRPGFEDFRSASPKFDSGFPSETMEPRKFSAPHASSSSSGQPTAPPRSARASTTADSESIPIKVIHEPRNKYNTTHSKTTDIPTRVTSGATSETSESPRVTRAHSEPPKPFNQRPQGMKTKIPLGNLAEQMENNLSTSASDSSVPNPGLSNPGSSNPTDYSHRDSIGPQQPSREPTAEQFRSGHATSTPSANIRHIPIFVEGRDKPVMNKDTSIPSGTSTQQPSREPTAEQFRSGHATSASNPAPPPPVPPKRPSEFGKNLDIKANNNLKEEPTSPLSPIPSDQPIPMGYTETDNSKVNGAENNSGSVPIPMPCSSDYLQNNNTNPSQSTTTSTPSANDNKPNQAKKPDPCLEKITKIQDNVKELVKQLEKFQGSKESKEYKYLDEMLTRNLLALDGLNLEGRDDVRQVRKESIKSINRCLSILESKASGANNEQATKNNEILSELASKE